MKSEQLSRRSLLTTGLKTSAAATIMSASTALGYQANSALTVGLIGCGGRGMYVSGIFAKNEFARVSAYCDIYQDKLDGAAKKYSGAKAFTKFQDLLATDVDAVLIATPAYLHPEHFEAAVKAKKHIFLEKPAGVGLPTRTERGEKGGSDQTHFDGLSTALRQRLSLRL